MPSMNAPERSRSYLLIDSDSIRAATPVEFRQLLDHIRISAGLTPSQIAIKTTIPRSQAYNMVAANRATMPSKPEQVRQFVEACGLSPVQVGLVMTLWGKLDQQAREQHLAGRVLSLVDGGAASDTNQHERIRQFFDSDVGASPNLGLRFSDDDDLESTRRPNSRVALDLLYLVLESETRTRNALKLLLPVALVFAAITISLMTWAIRQPHHTSTIGTILAGGILLSITRSLRRLRRRSRR